MSRNTVRSVTCLVVGVLGFAAASVAETEAPRRFNASFVYGSTKFNDSDAHRTIGATFRVKLTERLSVEPELRYMSVPSFESAFSGTVWKHSDLMVAGHVVYDFADEGHARVVPYVMGGAGWIQTRNESSPTSRVVESAVPVFPPAPPLQSSTSRTVTNWLWLGSAFGVRILLPYGFFVSPEIRVGGSKARDLTASAVIKMGYGF